MPMHILWFGAMVFFVIVEIGTMNLTSIWFALGSLAAFFVALFGGSFQWQIILFVAVSGLTLAFTRPFVKRFLDVPRKATNADRVYSMVGTVTEEVNNAQSTGTVKVGGKLWTARSMTGEVLKVGTYVRPQAIEGVKLIVIPVSGENQ